jgi:POT family proton-dependent oligopeptide transporter
MSATAAPQTEPDIAKKTPTILETLFNHPAGFWFIFWGELAERCSYYGMMSILARFISEKMIHADGTGLGDDNSATWVSLFKAGCYFLPLLGGFLADQYLGKYRLIVIFSIPYILGHVILAQETYWWTVVALSLLAMGSGVIKPNISTLMGLTYDQQRPGNEQLRSMAFGMFYMAINIGAAISTIAIPWIRDNYDYSYAFMCPAVLMAISFVIFAIGKPFYAVEKIERRHSTPEERQEKWATMLRVSGLFLVVTFFWAIFDQSHTTWVFFARDFTDQTLFGEQFSPEQFGVLNPVLIVIFVPLFQLGWNQLESRMGIHVRPTDKMVLGFVLTLLTMTVLAVAGFLCGPYTEVVDKGATRRIVEEASRVTIWWEVLAFVLLTAAEVLISVTGLELAFVLAPQSMKSFVTAMWLVTVALANLFINAPVARLYAYMPPGQYFALMAGMMVGVIFAFLFVAQRFNTSAAPPLIDGGQTDEIPPDLGSPTTGGIIDKSRREGIIDPGKKEPPASV